MTASGDNRIVVDWDSTCVEGLWPEMGDWLPGARESLKAFLDAGYEVTINSTRLAPTEVDEVTPRKAGAMKRERGRIRAMLDVAGLGAVSIWDKPWKPGAVAYIDDRGVRFDGDWAEILNRFVGAA